MDGLRAGPVSRLGRDLGTLLVVLALTWAVVALPGLRSTPVRTLVVVPAAVVLPGYAILAGLVPRMDAAPLLDDLTVRLLFTAALGVASLVVVGVALTSSPLGLTTASVLGTITVVTLGGIGAATIRRSRPAGTAGFDASEESFEGSPSVNDDGVLGHTLLVVVLLVGIAGLGVSIYLVAFATPPGFAEFEVTAVEGGPNATVAPGDQLGVRLHHREPGEATYTVVMAAERVDPDTGVVEGQRQLDQTTARLASGDSWTTRHEPPVPWPGRTRIGYRLYRGGGTDGSPDAEIHRWIESPGDPGGGSS